MRGGQFLTHLRTRVPWVITAVAVLVAVSTGTIWATWRIRSLDTDLTSAGKRSGELNEQVRRLRHENGVLQERLESIQAALDEAAISVSELKRHNEELQSCVSRSNPDGGPIVEMVPPHGPIGARVEMVGHCFESRFWRNEKDLLSGVGISLLGGIDSQGRVTSRKRVACELIARAGGDLDITRDGQMRGYFIVPHGGRCFKSKKTSDVARGHYFLIIGCRACKVGRFGVTNEDGELRRLEPCDRDDYGWSLHSPSAMGGTVFLGARIEARPGVTCRLEQTLTVTVTGSTGVALPIRGNSASARFDAALGRDRTSAAWAWQNWCGVTGPYEIRAVLGGENRAQQFSASPRCNFKKRGSRLDPIGQWMDGVASYTR